jgi:predicted CopG family antitoxin
MDTKTVALDQEAYALLRRAKQDGKSFSDVVKRLAGKGRKMMDFAGAWSDVPEGAWETMRGERRKAEKLREETKKKRWG